MTTTTSSQNVQPYKAGDVLRVPMVYTDHSEVKERPVVVVSVDAVHLATPDLIVVAVTSKDDPHYGNRPIMDLAEAGLGKPSNIKGVIQTVHSENVVAVWGRMSERDFAQVQLTLRDVLGL